MPYPPDEPANPSTEGLLGLGEAAEALGVHYMTAYRYVRTGRLEAHQAGGRWRIEPAALHALRNGTASGALEEAGTGEERRTNHRSRRRIAALADRLVAGDEPGAWRIVDDAFASGADLDDVYVGLLGASLREVGDRWAAGRATVAHEHRASVVAMRLVGRLGPRAARPGRPKGTVVIGAAPGDRHGLPSALLADLLRSRGMRVVDLGADTPPEHLADATAEADRLVAVGICATSPVDDAAVADLREAVRRVHERTAAPVLLGGRAVARTDLVARSGADASSLDTADALAWFSSVAANCVPAGEAVR